jgi:hypothetical protein
MERQLSTIRALPPENARLIQITEAIIWTLIEHVEEFPLLIDNIYFSPAEEEQVESICMEWPGTGLFVWISEYEMSIDYVSRSIEKEKYSHDETDIFLSGNESRKTMSELFWVKFEIYAQNLFG